MACGASGEGSPPSAGRRRRSDAPRAGARRTRAARDRARGRGAGRGRGASGAAIRGAGGRGRAVPGKGAATRWQTWIYQSGGRGARGPGAPARGWGGRARPGGNARASETHGKACLEVDTTEKEKMTGHGNEDEPRDPKPTFRPYEGEGLSKAGQPAGERPDLLRSDAPPGRGGVPHGGPSPPGRRAEQGGAYGTRGGGSSPRGPRAGVARRPEANERKRKRERKADLQRMEGTERKRTCEREADPGAFFAREGRTRGAEKRTESQRRRADPGRRSPDRPSGRPEECAGRRRSGVGRRSRPPADRGSPRAPRRGVRLPGGRKKGATPRNRNPRRDAPRTAPGAGMALAPPPPRGGSEEKIRASDRSGGAPTREERRKGPGRCAAPLRRERRRPRGKERERTPGDLPPPDDGTSGGEAIGRRPATRGGGAEGPTTANARVAGRPPPRGCARRPPGAAGSDSPAPLLTGSEGARGNGGGPRGRRRRPKAFGPEDDDRSLPAAPARNERTEPQSGGEGEGGGRNRPPPSPFPTTPRRG